MNLKETEDLSCLEVITETVKQEPGILNVDLDTSRELVAFDFDPKKVSPARVAQIAASLKPTLHKRWQTCTMRLGKTGGRACESCALDLERRLHSLPGINRVTASYLGGVMSVTYDKTVVTPAEIARRVEQLGIPVLPSASEPAARADEESSDLWARRLQILFTAVTLISMVGGWMAERAEAAPWLVTLLFTTAYLTGGAFGLKSSLQSLKARTIDIDLLMILAAVGAAVVGAPFEGVMLLFLFSLSNVLQEYALDRTRNAIRALMDLRPSTANVQKGDRIVNLPIEQVQISDQVIVKPGERIPLDGVVLTGQGAVDQSSLTGESIPVNKEEGDIVFAGTINQSGRLEIGVTRLAKDSTIAKLIQLVEEAHSEKAETQRFIDRAERTYALGVILFTALVIITPQLFNWEPFADSFYRAMTIMVAASPCALVISTPATVLSAIGNGARRGILFKGGVYVENAATIKVVAFDKTGTLTIGEPKVTDVEILDSRDQSKIQNPKSKILQLAAAVESHSEHPLAQAVVTAAAEQNLDLPEATGFEAVTGKGVRGNVDGRVIHIGNLRYFKTMQTAGLETAVSVLDRLQSEGKTSVLVAEMVGDAAHILGVIALADVLRDEAAVVVANLKKQGIERVVMLTGDNQQVARNIAAQAGVDEALAELMPEDKVTAVKQIAAKYGPVAMVGDGVNDAPALATAAIGIAMGAAGTDVALETADIVLMSDDLHNLPYLIGLSRKTRRTLAMNLGFSLMMILIMIGAIFTSGLSLPLAVIGHEGGTVLVSLNGLTLLTYKGTKHA